MDWGSISIGLFITQLLLSGVRLATPLVLAALGEIYAERSGILNLGVEGIMLFSGFVGFTLAYETDSLWVGVLAAVAVGTLMGLLFAFLTITLRSNQVVTGLSLMILSNGLAIYLYRLKFSISLSIPRLETFGSLKIPLLSEIPFLGPVFFDQSPFTYLMFLLVPVSLVVLYRTPFGLRIHAVGESPQTADTLGVSVAWVRYLCTAIGGALAGLAGSFFPLSELGVYADTMIGGRGFIALALVIFGRWDPLWVLAGGVLFGGIDALQNRLQSMGSPIPSNFLLMTPYLLTILVLLLGRSRKPPAALCIPYARE
jgi:simple sugar transport system permease protein